MRKTVFIGAVLILAGLASGGETDVEAEASFLAMIRKEADAGRPGSVQGGRALLGLWRLYARGERYDLAGIAFSKLVESHPRLVGARWYLAHARLAEGDAAAAADGFEEVTGLSPEFAGGWQMLGTASIRADRPADARRALLRAAELDPDGRGTADLLEEVAKKIAGGGEPGPALADMEALLAEFPEECLLREKRADLLCRAGRYEEAIREYRDLADELPFADEIPLKERKATARLLRTGARPEGVGLAPRAAPRNASGAGGPIYDFEGARVFVTTTGNGRGRRVGGAFHLRRVPGRETAANLVITMIPTLDTRPFASLRLTVEGPAGTTMLVHASDAYDEFDVSRGPGRLTHRTRVLLDGTRREVTLPLDGFEVSLPYRPIPLNRSRLRALMLDIGYLNVEGATPPSRLAIDDVALVREDGTALVLADFDEEPDETLFVADGVASALARTFYRLEDIPRMPPERNTYVSPLILPTEFEPWMVFSGRGSHRLHLPAEGDAGGLLVLGPGHGPGRARSLVFRARGHAGGERVRVTLRDRRDDEVGGAPASAPRRLEEGTIREGWFVLGPEWREYRIPLSDFPDLDASNLTRIRFRFGTDEGNAVGTTWYLDDIAWK